MAACDIMVVGSYPPMPGPATAATLSAVKRAWQRGATVAMVSYRTGAAPLAVPVTGPLAGWRLEQVRRHFGAPAEVSLGLQHAAPFSDRRLGARLVTAGTLTWALRRFAKCTLVVAEDPKAGMLSLRLLARSGARFSVPGAELARRLQRYGVPAGAIDVESVAPFPAATPAVAASGVPDRGLYAPGPEANLTFVDIPSTTTVQRLRARTRRVVPGPARRLLSRLR